MGNERLNVCKLGRFVGSTSAHMGNVAGSFKKIVTEGSSILT